LGGGWSTVPPVEGPPKETHRHSQPIKTELFSTTQKLRSHNAGPSPKHCILDSDFQSLFYGSGRTSFTIQNDLAKNLGRNPNNQGKKSRKNIFTNSPELQADRGVKVVPPRRIRPRPGHNPTGQPPTSLNSSRNRLGPPFWPGTIPIPLWWLRFRPEFELIGRKSASVPRR